MFYDLHDSGSIAMLHGDDHIEMPRNFPAWFEVGIGMLSGAAILIVAAFA